MENVGIRMGNDGLFQQGYDYSPEELKSLSWGLRFTPSLCMLFAIYGLSVQQPGIHFILAGLGIIPFWFPDKHPFDRLYNYGLRHLWGGVALPPNPLPRRIACFMGGSMNILIGVSFMAGSPTWAYIFGAILIPLQILVITTHFCLASWMYEQFMKIIGQWDAPLPIEEIQTRLAQGAQLVDVRSREDFQQGHLPDAINIPAVEISKDRPGFPQVGVVLYCKSGLQSQEALQRLKRQGYTAAYNLGAMSRWPL